MNLSDNTRSNYSVSLYTNPSPQITPLQNFPLQELKEPRQLPVPEALIELGKRIGLDGEIPETLEKRKITSMKTVEDINEAFGSVLAKTQKGLLLQSTSEPASYFLFYCVFPSDWNESRDQR